MEKNGSIIITPNLRKIVFMSRMGMTDKEIAAHFKIDPSAISQYRKRNRDAWKKEHLSIIDEAIQAKDLTLQAVQNKKEYDEVPDDMKALAVYGVSKQKARLQREKFLVIKGEWSKLESPPDEMVGKSARITSGSILKAIRQSEHPDVLIDLFLSRDP